MNKIKVIIGTFSIIFLLFSLQMTAQSRKEIKGDKLMGKYHFLSAAQVYEKVMTEGEGDAKTRKKLADCYRMLNDPENTVKWYDDIIENIGIVEPIDRFYYAQALSSIGEYDKAKKWYGTYSLLDNSDDRAVKFSANLDNLNMLYLDSSRFNMSEVSFNSIHSDFSPAFYQDQLVFVSARGEKGNFKWNESAFLDLYICSTGPEGKFNNPVPFYKKLNTKYHEGPLAFYNDGKSLVLTRNNFEGGTLLASSKGVSKLKLYFTSIDEDGNWEKVLPFQYNSNEYSIGHPAITEDGKTLYFISDMPGGHGGTDIYVTYKNGKEWSKPENLGEPVNTKGNEMFPFFHEKKVLFFASNGLGGLGGLDIFKNEIGSPEVKNMGYPINSAKDDFGFILDAIGKMGFLASNRNTENGTDNIYQFIISEPKPLEVKITVLDTLLEVPIPMTSIAIDGLENADVADDKGKATLPLFAGEKYKIKVSKKGYKPKELDYSTTDGLEIIVRLKKECLLAKGLVDLSGANSGDKIIQVVIFNQDAVNDTLLVLRNNYYEFCVEPAKDYTLTFSKEKYFSKSINFTPNGNEIFELEKTVLEEIVLNKAIRLENIYYDLAKWDIREDAAKELNKLVKILRDNPTVEIELSSHTDSRGSDAYNLKLSDKRAKSAREYIVSKGIEPQRIIAEGYGETALINECANGISCSKEAHQANRRTEFKVLRY